MTSNRTTMSPDYNEADLRRIIVDNNPEQLVRTADALGKKLVQGGLATAQIRNIFGTARRIQAKWLRTVRESRGEIRREYMMLIPKLEYQSQRESAIAPLKAWLIPALRLVYEGHTIETADPGEDVETDRYARFMDFFEAVLAYHVAHGGRSDKGGR